MTIDRQLRLSLLIVTFAGVMLALVRGMQSAAVGPSSAIGLPGVVPLSGWQALPSQPLVDPAVNSPRALYPQYVAGRQYQYRAGNQRLDVQIHYLTHTDGNVPALIQRYALAQLPIHLPELPLRQHPGVGFYSLYTQQGRAYLSACINPRGGSTVTAAQFAHNRHTYDLQISRLLPWLAGQADLRDWRCIWVHASTPLESATEQDAYKILENAWISLYHWWSTQFPEL